MDCSLYKVSIVYPPDDKWSNMDFWCQWHPYTNLLSVDRGIILKWLLGCVRYVLLQDSVVCEHREESSCSLNAELDVPGLQVYLHFSIRCSETGPRGCHDNVRCKSVVRHYRQLVGLSLHTFLSASACCLGIPALSLLRRANYNLILSLGGCNRRHCAKACARLYLGSCKK
jgi:hypothetical protein